MVTELRVVQFGLYIILVIRQIGLPLRGRPILLITRMITDRIGLHSVLLPLLIIITIIIIIIIVIIIIITIIVNIIIIIIIMIIRMILSLYFQNTKSPLSFSWWLQSSS